MRSKKALINIVTTIIQQIVTIICGFIVPRLIIKNFGSDINGMIISITQFLSYITLLESGIGSVIKSQLYKPVAKKNKKEISDILYASDKFFKLISKIFIVYILILIVIYPTFISKDFDKIFTIALLLIISASTLAEYYFGITYKIYLQVEQKTYIVSCLQIITTILNTISVIILINIGANVLIVKLLSSTIFIIRPILQNIYVKKKYKIDLNEADKNYKLEKKWDGLVQHIAAVVHNNTDVAILTIFDNVLEVSVYSVYNLVVNGVSRLIQSLTSGIDASFGDMIAKEEYNTLNKSFSAYELIYFTMITMIYGCTLVLITPFVKVYTSGVNDVNYIRPVFGVLIVLSSYVHAMRLPYSTLCLSAGHFKETKKGACVEAIVNTLLSLILVNKLGITGVVIGTLIAMLIRTIEFIIHSSDSILKRKKIIGFKRILISIIEIIVIFIISNYIGMINCTTYLTWLINAIIVLSISITVVIINYFAFKEDRKEVIVLIKRILNHRREVIK